MNKDDGSWRFIYVGPSGQLIGSLRRTSLLQGVLSTPVLPGAALMSGPGLGASAGGATAPGQAGQLASAGNTPGLQGSSQGFNSLGAQPQSLQGAVIGGNIIGVGSKVKQPSLRVYEGGDTYETWEFIWNPQTQIAVPGQGTNPLAPTATPGAASNNVLSPGQGAPGQLIQGGSTTQPPTDSQGGAGPPPQNPPVQ